jgi:hypothetical protein
MTYNWTFFRDQIVLNNDFKTRTKLDTLPMGTTLLLAAREFIVDGVFTLDGRDLVLLADRFDGSQGEGAIQVQALADGMSGPKVTVVCRELAGINITSTGGIGLEGELGAPGSEGQPGRPAPLPHKPGGPGGRGGKGGIGGRGQVGGSGGHITLVYMEDHVPGGFKAATLQVPGGPGGLGGAGGPGGPGGEGGPGDPDGPTGPDGPQGDRGSMGPTGAPGIVQTSQVAEAEYWQVLLPLADQWAAYRLRMGEYFFRAANPSGPPASDYLDLALSEFNAVLQLDPQNVQAATYKNQLLNNQNVLGLARDIDIIPDFEYYEQVVTQYGPLVLNLFDSASDLLIGNLTLDQMRQTLTREIAHIDGLTMALKAERSAAELGLLAAKAERDMAINRFNANESRIRARREELEKKQVKWGDVLAFAGITILTCVFTMGSGGVGMGLLASFMPDILMLTGDDKLPFSDADRKAVLEKARGLKEFAAFQKDPIGTSLPMALSFAKMIKDVDEAEGDAELLKLLRESVELTHAKLTTQLRNEQAAFTLQAATIRLDQAQRDLDLARAQLAGLIDDEEYLNKVALTLIRSAQDYMDVLIKYAFFAARALEIYTLTDISDEIHYDYGYIHSDIEQDYRDRLLPLAQFIGAYKTSWGRFVGIINYRNSYDNYFVSGSKVDDKVFVSITDPGVLAQFRETQSLLLPINLADLPPTRFEAKAIYVLLALTGASANVPAISCLVEHAGRFSSRKRDGSISGLVLRPRVTVVQTAKTGLTYTGVRIGTNPSELSFWGRGVATAWHVSIEPDEMARQQIDLSGLSAIEIEIGYEAFL